MEAAPPLAALLDTAMMVLMAKLPSKLLPLASVYCPTAQVHAARNTLMVQGYKHMTGISRHAHTNALWGPWEHGCQGCHDWTPELRVCCQPPDTLPSDTRLHRLLVALLGVQVQVNAPLHAQLWDDHQHACPGQLQSAGVWAPTIVWLSEPPADAYWQWAQASPAPLVTVTTTLPPWPWIAIALAAVAKVKYPAECVAHRCPRHPNKGPLYYSLVWGGGGIAVPQA